MRILIVLISSHIVPCVFHESQADLSQVDLSQIDLSQINLYLHDDGEKGNSPAEVFLEELLLSIGFSIFIWDICRQMAFLGS